MSDMHTSNEETPRLDGETILVIDDEDLLLEVTAMMLEDMGAKVFSAHNGVEGVELFRVQSSAITAVVVDFSMPVKNGYETYLDIKSISNQVGVIMASGLRVIPEVEELRRSGAIEFLSKPFREEELVQVLLKLAAARMGHR